MGYQMKALTQKRVDGKWVNIETLERSHYEPDEIVTCFVRDDVMWQRHWDWLGMDADFRHSKPKGLPLDMRDERNEVPNLPYGYKTYAEMFDHGDDCAVNWHWIDDLLQTDWYSVVKPNEWEDTQTLRQWIGQPFIDWLEKLKALGVERIVYSFG